MEPRCALESNTSVKTLDVSESNLADSGTRLIVKTLKKNSSVTCLRLRNNGIGSDGAQALANAIQINRSLEYLYISSNMGMGGCLTALIESVKTNTTLKHIGLWNCGVTQQEGLLMEEAIRTNGTLQHCVSGQNDENIWALCERNRNMHTKARLAALTIICVRRFRKSPQLSGVPKDVVKIIAERVFKTKSHIEAWHQDVQKNSWMSALRGLIGI